MAGGRRNSPSVAVCLTRVLFLLFRVRGCGRQSQLVSRGSGTLSIVARPSSWVLRSSKVRMGIRLSSISFCLTATAGKRLRVRPTRPLSGDFFRRWRYFQRPACTPLTASRSREFSQRPLPLPSSPARSVRPSGTGTRRWGRGPISPTSSDRFNESLWGSSRPSRIHLPLPFLPRRLVSPFPPR